MKTACKYILIFLSLTKITHGQHLIQEICDDERTTSEYWHCEMRNFTTVPEILRTQSKIPLWKCQLSNNIIQLISRNIFTELLLQMNSENKTESLCVESLLLNQNQISKIETEAFDAEPGCLNSLDLSRNKLTNLPLEELQKLKNLTVLKLDYNNFKSIEKFSFTNFSKLELLSLDFCQIQFIQPYSFSGLSNLKELFIRGNLVTQVLPFTFSDLPNLKDLYISWNEIYPIEINAFDGIASNPIIQRHSFLNISGEVLKDGRPISPILISNQNQDGKQRCEGNTFETGKLSEWKRNNYSHPEDQNDGTEDDFFRYISCFSFTEIPKLVIHNRGDASNKFVLSFESNGDGTLVKEIPTNIFTERFLQTFSKSAQTNLTSLPVLSLDFSYNKINSIDEEAFTGEIGVLRKLILNNNKLTEIPKKALQSLKHLKHTDFSNNNFRVIKAHSFDSMNYLQKLDLSSCEIQTIEPYAFSGLPNLTILSLGGNNFSSSIQSSSILGLSNSTKIDMNL